MAGPRDIGTQEEVGVGHDHDTIVDFKASNSGPDGVAIDPLAETVPPPSLLATRHTNTRGVSAPTLYLA